jgi:predicted Co/Zn/Cd cation transporter (cation efflux family)
MHHCITEAKESFFLYFITDCIMRIRVLLTLLICLLVITLQKTTSQAYSILNLKPTATNAQVEAQYKKLRSKYRRNRIKKSMVRQAYDQILFERQF